MDSAPVHAAATAAADDDVLTAKWKRDGRTHTSEYNNNINIIF